MDALRINEPFGNNFRSRTASFKANRTNRDPFPLSRAKYRSCNSFLLVLQHFDRRNERFYFAPRE